MVIQAPLIKNFSYGEALFKDQTQGSAQYRQAIYHWKALFAENLIGPIVIFLCHVTLRHSREKLQIHSLGLKMKHA